MKFRDRIRELRRVPAATLRRHPLNWRKHPPGQRRALQAALAELGFADALVARELPDGSLELIDGHLRAETASEGEVPVLVVDLSDEEARKLLAVLDPLAGMAESDGAVWDRLTRDLSWNDRALADLVGRWVAEAPPAGEPASASGEPAEATRYQVVVDCADEAEQRSVYERLCEEGRQCRLLMLW